METQAIPDEEKKIKVNFLRYKAKYYVRLSPEVEQKALQFIKLGVKPMDALQLASAERGAEVFITVDKRLLKKARKIHTLRVRKFFKVPDFTKIYVLTLSFLKEKYSTRRKPLHSTTVVIDCKLWNRLKPKR